MTKRLIGIGNPDRGDDAAGWEVAARVTSWETTCTMAGSFDLIDTWDGTDDVVIVDAMQSGRPPGTIEWFDALAGDLPTFAFTSTHAFGPAEIVALARAMGRMPRSLEVVGIEVDSIDHGAELSSVVADAVTALAKELEHA
jgi:hydrogenase maturation protease